MYAFVIGNHNMIMGFRLVGVRGAEVSSVDEAWRVLSKTVKNVDVAIIIIDEEFSTKIRDKIDKLRLSRISPLIVEMPGKLRQPETIDISDIVRKAIGVKM